MVAHSSRSLASSSVCISTTRLCTSSVISPSAPPTTPGTLVTSRSSAAGDAAASRIVCRCLAPRWRVLVLVSQLGLGLGLGIEAGSVL